jgi:hypothetical protein
VRRRHDGVHATKHFGGLAHHQRARSLRLDVAPPRHKEPLLEEIGARREIDVALLAQIGAVILGALRCQDGVEHRSARVGPRQLHVHELRAERFQILDRRSDERLDLRLITQPHVTRRHAERETLEASVDVT